MRYRIVTEQEIILSRWLFFPGMYDITPRYDHTVLDAARAFAQHGVTVQCVDDAGEVHPDDGAFPDFMDMPSEAVEVDRSATDEDVPDGEAGDGEGGAQ